MADKPVGVYALIAAVQAELAETGIAKAQRNQQQGYAFRGIDDVYRALAPLLAKHGLVVLPVAEDHMVSERETKSGNALFNVAMKVSYDFVSSHDGSSHRVTVYGEAMDSGDKATNKALSAAYKYACFQTFCIPTEGDNDADSTTHEPVKARPQPGQSAGGHQMAGKAATSKQIEFLKKLLSSHLITDAEAEKYADALTMLTQDPKMAATKKIDMKWVSEAIEYWKPEIEDRRAHEAEASKNAPEGTSEDQKDLPF